MKGLRRGASELQSESKQSLNDSTRAQWQAANSFEVINIIAEKIYARMWANSVHTCIVTCRRSGWVERLGAVGVRGFNETKGEGGLYLSLCMCICMVMHMCAPGGQGWMRKERGGQPDKQNPCCFISARLASHRPFMLLPLFLSHQPCHPCYYDLLLPLILESITFWNGSSTDHPIFTKFNGIVLQLMYTSHLINFIIFSQ